MSELWPPTTEAGLDSALKDGLLAEGQHVDLKRQLPPAGKNRDLAIDLAAFSIDGGTIFVGVAEGKSGPVMTPIPLAGLAERLEQIGLASIDPPVVIRAYGIETGGKPGHGVLVVIVPPSPAAPHMVEGQYRARADKTNYVMTDAQVSRVRGEFERRVDGVNEALAAYARLAIPRHREGPLLLVVAVPISGRDDLLRRCAGDDPLAWLKTTLLNGPLGRPLVPSFAPDFTGAIRIGHRANGWAVQAGDHLDLEVHESGVLRLRVGELGFKDELLINDVAMNGLVKRLVLSAAAVGLGCSHYGAWDFATTVIPLLGYRSVSATGARRGRMPPYSEEVYHRSTSATYEELSKDPDAVVEGLLGRLNRAISGAAAVIPS